MSHKPSSYIPAILLILMAAVFFVSDQRERSHRAQIRQLIEEHAHAWETGCATHFHTHFRDTKISIKKIIVEGDSIAVEWLVCFN